MKNLKIILLGLIVIIGLSFVSFFFYNYQIQIQPKVNQPIKLPPIISNQCGIENCHGLEISCGPNVPEYCDMKYSFGDRCRQFAQCGLVDGKCQQIENSVFTDCKICVEKCQENFAQDFIQLSNCESNCVMTTDFKKAN